MLRTNYRIRKRIKGILFWLTLLFIFAIFLMPLYWVITTSFKTRMETFAYPPKIVFTPTFDNYKDVLSSDTFLKGLVNSLVTSLVPTAIAVVVGTPAAYALAHLEFKNKHRYTIFVLFARILPPLSILFPMYVVFFRMKLIGTYTPMIITYTMFILPLVVWLLPVYFKNIPGDLRESAIIDGASEFGVFTHIMLPLVKPGLSATVIFTIVQAWNEFLFGLVFSNKSTQTLVVSLTSYMSFEGVQWGRMCAAGTLIMAPMIIFGIIIQNNFVSGLTLGSVKG